MKQYSFAIKLFIVTVWLFGQTAQNHLHAFCGFYVAKADASLYNKASQVVFVRNGNRSVISMLNDYEGDPKEFAMVVPVPNVLKRGQINVGEKALFEHIDAYSAPRLVEYFDRDPCSPAIMERSMGMAGGSVKMAKGKQKKSAKDLGVKIEAKYTVGEYDIVILSGEQSDGLETWLKQGGYKIPKGAAKVLKPYIAQKMKFFVAKVNIKEKIKAGLSYLRPLQMAFESEKFMLPIRLGLINSKGKQDLLIYLLSKDGRVETTNYRTVKIPSGLEIPVHLKSDFANFYRATFEESAKKENYKVAFLEYFWDMAWCDPCAADPLSHEELRKLGVFWLKDQKGMSKPRPIRGRVMPPPRAANVRLTRLHIRYDKESFPDDLMFQETKDRRNFQGRYILRHAWKGDRQECSQAENYFQNLEEQMEKRAQTAARLTGWDISKIRQQMSFPKPVEEKKDDKNWWERLWGS